MVLFSILLCAPGFVVTWSRSLWRCIHFIDPNGSRVACTLCWFISFTRARARVRQYTTRNTNSVTHSMGCMCSRYFRMFWKYNKYRKNKNCSVFEEWYLHDLRSPTRTIEQKKMKWICVCCVIRRFDIRPPILLLPLLLLSTVVCQLKMFTVRLLESAIVHYVRWLCFWTTLGTTIVCWAHVCPVCKRLTDTPFPTNDTVNAIVFLCHHWTHAVRCITDDNNNVKYLWIYECVDGKYWNHPYHRVGYIISMEKRRIRFQFQWNSVFISIVAFPIESGATVCITCSIKEKEEK